MKKTTSGFYLVQEVILPEAIKKTIKVKELLKRGEVRTINEAVAKMNLSRSAYYKYKDYVFPFYDSSQNKIIILSFMLENRNGVLLNVLHAISKASGNVLTIHQEIPQQGVADVTISVETASLAVCLEELIDKIQAVEGVKGMRVLGWE